MAESMDRIELVGARLRLRTTTPDDSPVLIAIRSTDEVRSRWRGEDVQAEIAADLQDDELTQLTIELNGRVIGLIQFSEESDPEYRHASVDLYIDPAFHRRGYAGEAIRLLVAYLFQERGHHRLVVDPDADNLPAIGCYSSVGFRAVGLMREYEHCSDGRWADGLLMEMLASDWADNGSSG